jgi:AcrR family transcriptional regulator
MRTVNTDPQKGRRSTQRERLLTGAIAAANRHGYGGANVSEIIEEAGVSRPTFYEYFTNKDDCLLAAFGAVHEELLGELREAMGAPGADPACVCVQTLVNFARSQPARARFQMGEVLAAGPSALDTRNRAVDEVAAAIAAAESAVEDGPARPDIPMRSVVGGVQRLLASRLRRGPVDADRFLEEILPWLESYRRPPAEHRWRAIPRLKLPASPAAAGMRLQAPPTFGLGRPRSSPGEVAENHRQRLIFAAASLAAEQGYAATTVADVTDHARLDRRAFYAIFQNKRDLFMAVHEFAFQRLLAVTAGAFFGGVGWPQRTWAGAQGLCEFLGANPTIAHVGFVEGYAVGPGAVQRIEDSVSAFSVFLQEGYRHEQACGSPSELALAAIISTEFEILHHVARQRVRPSLGGMVGALSYISLAPFIGPTAADQAIDEELERRTSAAEQPS